MNYCKSCSANYTDEYIKQNLINTETRTNVVQCRECFNVDNIVKLYGYNDKCSICLNKNSNVYFDDCKHCFCNNCIYDLNYKCALCNTLNNKTMQCSKTTHYFNNLEIKDLFKILYAHTHESLGLLDYSHEFRYNLYIEYHKWLTLLIENDNNNNPEKLSPSNLIDQLWHAHILDLKNYIDVCMAMNNEILIHYVENGFEAGKNKYSERFYKTMVMYDKKYGNISKKLESIWKPSYKLTNAGKNMHIFFRSISGVTITVLINECAYVSELKEIIQQKEKVSACSIRLMYGGKQLQDDYLLKSYGISECSSVDVMGRLCGC